jgi:hypothetical protein
MIHCVRNEAELQSALRATDESTRPHPIEIILPCLDAPDSLVRFAGKAAEFDFRNFLKRRSTKSNNP